jgi:putative FmdB family regulatory protein
VPIFEYACGSCGTSFELLVRGSGQAVTCPSCASATVVRKLSLFAAHTKRAETAVPPCHGGAQGCDLGRCGSGLCGAR